MNEWVDLASVETHIWARLAEGVSDSNDPWRFVTLATVGVDGPQARLVGLRGANRALGTVEVHTDARTPKVLELQQNPLAQLLFWDVSRQEQLRLSLKIEVVRADPERWEQIPIAARGNYGTVPQPGTELASAQDYVREPDPSYFAALVGQVFAIDAVNLGAQPHRRAQWRNDVWKWVAP